MKKFEIKKYANKEQAEKSLSAIKKMNAICFSDLKNLFGIKAQKRKYSVIKKGNFYILYEEIQ